MSNSLGSSLTNAMPGSFGFHWPSEVLWEAVAVEARLALENLPEQLDYLVAKWER